MSEKFGNRVPPQERPHHNPSKREVRRYEEMRNWPTEKVWQEYMKEGRENPIEPLQITWLTQRQLGREIQEETKTILQRTREEFSGNGKQASESEMQDAADIRLAERIEMNELGTREAGVVMSAREHALRGETQDLVDLVTRNMWQNGGGWEKSFQRQCGAGDELDQKNMKSLARESTVMVFHPHNQCILVGLPTRLRDEIKPAVMSTLQEWERAQKEEEERNK